MIQGLDRRTLLKGIGASLAAPLLWSCKKAVGALASVFATWPVDARRTLEAAADRILPGAGEAGAMDYLSYWLARPPFAARAYNFERGALALDRCSRREHTVPFADAAAEIRDQCLEACRSGRLSGKNFDSAAFFRELVQLTLESFFSEPRYGGNRGQVGWAFIAWKPCWWSPRHRM